jgi:hypothetical protein
MEERMISVHFKKDYAESVIEAIKTGQPIPPVGAAGWSQTDMLTLAGILYMAVFSHGPHREQLARATSAGFQEPHRETREAVTETFQQDIHDGIDFVSRLTSMVVDREFDADFQPEVKAVLSRDASGRRIAAPVKGFKGEKDLI